MADLTGIIGLVIAFFLLVNGFAALRRPLDMLLERDPLGRLLVKRWGEKRALIIYRAYGAVFVLLGAFVAYTSFNMLRGM
jgi:hypothetical protein